MKKISENKIFALVLIILSGFTPLVKEVAHANGILLDGPPTIIKFISQEDFKFLWYILIILGILLILIDYLAKGSSKIYKVVLFLLIVAVYIVRSLFKEGVDMINTIHLVSGLASLSWGWYLIYAAILLFIFDKKKD